jgi:2-oxoglutarate ferredoxin oxidoreductase subunit beta
MAQEYGTKLFTGVFYRNPEPEPTYGQLMRKRHKELKGTGLPRERILETFTPS